MPGFSDLERHILDELQAGNSLLKAVLEKVCEMKTEECRRACAQHMAHVPAGAPFKPAFGLSRDFDFAGCPSFAPHSPALTWEPSHTPSSSRPEPPRRRRSGGTCFPHSRENSAGCPSFSRPP